MMMIIAVVVAGSVCFAGGYMLGNSGGDDGGDREALVIAGSTTVQPLMLAFQEEYEKDHKVAMFVSGGGSGAGVTNAFNGTAHLGMISRELTANEKSATQVSGAYNMKAHAIAYDAVVMIVPDAVYNAGVQNITSAQLAGIFAGDIDNWNGIDGCTTSIPIKTVARESTSGTRDAFNACIMVPNSKTFGTPTWEYTSTNAVLTAVASAEGAGSIGYVGMDNLNHLPAGVKYVKVDGVTPGETEVRNKLTDKGTSATQYPISRTLYVCTFGDADGIALEFIKWVQSAAGQAVVKEQGFVTLS